MKLLAIEFSLVSITSLFLLPNILSNSLKEWIFLYEISGSDGETMKVTA
jgi:hypothetical protein